MAKTAMAQMLAELKLQLGAEKLSQMIDETFWSDLERQQIEEAYGAGAYDGIDLGAGYGQGKHSSSYDYYENKYK